MKPFKQRWLESSGASGRSTGKPKASPRVGGGAGRAWGILGGFGGGLALLGIAAGLGAAEFRIDYLRVAPDGGIEVGYPAEAGSFYRLLRGDTVDRVDQPVAVTFSSLVALPAVDDANPQRFFVVEKLPLSSDVDSDGDGIPDVYELFHPGILNPLDPADALLDVSGNGLTALQEYLASLDAGLTTVRATSPVAGETGVSVNRETVLYFSGSLGPEVVLSTAVFSAAFGGRQILARTELSSDRRKATLFYLEPLPGAARIRVTFDGTGMLDAAGRELDVDGDGVPGGRLLLDFDTASQTPLEGTIVAGRVFASELATPTAGSTNLSVNVPLAGVVVTADGLEERVRAMTDSFGNFRITNAPPGDFFVHIDGRTVRDDSQGIRYPDRAYYPFVGKLWTSLPGGETNIGNVYLPLVSAGTLQPVNALAPTTVTFPSNVLAQYPELAGVSITVPANALFSDNGTRGGQVGIAPVPPDRLPGPLPPGLSFPLVITVQTDGPSNFDQPVPACFPNLPDPVTGERLAPGAKSALWSFNHDTGLFEIVGPMTVSADGRLVCTDPGVGIPAPGWHGTSPAASGGGGGPGGGPGPNPPGPDSGCNPAMECCDPVSGAGNDSNPVKPFSGEKYEQAIDLRIPGVGMDFVWARTYGSRTGPQTAQGNGWDFSYNLCLVPSGHGIAFCNGAYRQDVYLPMPRSLDGGGGNGVVATRVQNGFFQELLEDAEGRNTLVMADGKVLSFHPLDGSARAGKIERMTDRNGNTKGFAYDTAGRLDRIIDTLDREIRVVYDSDGFITEVRDFAGRSVRYAYYGQNEAGGSFGDLKSVTMPAVTGTPNGNDYPQGKVTSYTYSKGFADANLNHNLLTITDGRRNDPNDPTFGEGPYVVNIYSTATNPGDPSYDRVIRQIRGGTQLVYTYLHQTPGPGNQLAVLKVIQNDRLGNVTEFLYDAGNRLVNRRQFTGRAVVGIPVSETLNRPVNPVRPGDPVFFESRFEYNEDHLLTREIHPNGNVTERIYEGDLNPAAPPRARGNLRMLRHLPGTHEPAGDQTVIEETFEYDTDFNCGSCGFNFVTRHTDGRGHATVNEYDERGNLVRRTRAVTSVVYEFDHNDGGQLIRRTLPDQGSGSRRVDEYVYFEAGAQRGYLRQAIQDAANLRLTTTYAYDAVGNVVSVTDARGNPTHYSVNTLNQVVRVLSREVTSGSGIRHLRDYFYDANDNLIRVDLQNRDDQGILLPLTHFTTTYDYDLLNHLVRESRQVDAERAVVNEFHYDPKRNLVRKRFGEAVAGRDPHNVVELVYDERDHLYEEILGPGSPDQSTRQFHYDPNGNLVRRLDGLESGAHVTQFAYDGFDRPIGVTDAMGNTTLYHYDAAGNRVRQRVWGELVDLPGSEGNVRLRDIAWRYDALNRPTRREEAFFNPSSQAPIGDGVVVSEISYTDASMVRQVVNDNLNATTIEYDTAHRQRAITDARGNVVTYTYDPNSNVTAVTSVEKDDLGGPDQVFATTYTHDNLDRIIRETDNVGNHAQFHYDSRNLRTRVVDRRGNVTRHVYDGLRRLMETTRELTATGQGGGAALGAVVTRQSWDDSNRLLSQTDPNGNVTSYVYDSLSRLIEERQADETAVAAVFDAHHRRVQLSDANGTRQDLTYDYLGRLIGREVIPGTGVLADTTFERLQYDGLSRLVSGENDHSVIALAFDSRSGMVRETLNGRTTTSVFDGVGNALSCEYPGGRVITTEYDTLERRVRVRDQSALIADYRYVGAGRVHRREYGNGTRLSLEYDGITGRPNPTGDLGVKQIIRGTHSVSATGALLDDRAYAFDEAQNTRSQRDLLPGGTTEVYRFDSLNRLLASERSTGGGPAETIAYSFDAAGNRLTVSGGPDAGSYVMDPAVPSPADLAVHQYTATPFDAREYDLQGNLTLAGVSGADGKRFGYDFQNRLVAVTNLSTGVVVRYVYDVLGRRIERSSSGGVPTITRYYYRGDQEIEETDAAGNVLATYVYGNYLDEVLSMRRGGADFYFHADRLYSVRAVTDATGVVVERYRYGDYGQPTILSAAGAPRPASAVGNELMFTGRRYDADTELYYYRTRWLDPRAGRFISRDTIGIWKDGLNLGNGLTYAGNNPVSRVDPYGLFAGVPAVPAMEVLLGTGTAGAGTATAGATGAGAGVATVGAATVGAAVAVGVAVGATVGMAYMEVTGKAPFQDQVQWVLDQILGNDDPTIPDGEPVPELEGEPVLDDPQPPAPTLDPDEQPTPTPDPGPRPPDGNGGDDGDGDGNGCPKPKQFLRYGINVASALANAQRELQGMAPPGCRVTCVAIARPKPCGSLYEVAMRCKYERTPR